MKKTWTDWREEQNRQEKAADLAEDIIIRHHEIVLPPVDPTLLVLEEHQLCVIGDDFRDAFDGMLEYHRSKHRFLLFYNTKYDLSAREHHPRTRFSLAHELGHFFIDRHRVYLISGGSPHGSRGEFTAEGLIEHEADAFAATLLMPKSMLGPMVNKQPVTLSSVEKFADLFRTSLISTAIQSVHLSDFPCAVVGIREGQIGWAFLSTSLREGGCSAVIRGQIRSLAARSVWRAFVAGSREKSSHYASSRDWFLTLDREYLQYLTVTEEFLPVPVMNTLLAFLTIREQELYPGLR